MALFDDRVLDDAPYAIILVKCIIKLFCLKTNNQFKAFSLVVSSFLSQSSIDLYELRIIEQCFVHNKGLTRKLRVWEKSETKRIISSLCSQNS